MLDALPWLSASPLVNGVHQLCPPSPFEEHYAAVRSKEQRILSDDQVRQLPDGTGLWNADEWRIRSGSARRLIDELARGGKTLRVLEVGCGNGWLSAMMQQHGHQVLGIDLFTSEQEQAARAFPGGPAFARADLFNSSIPNSAFDVVIFAASIQYFADIRKTIGRALELVHPHGTVHVLDTVLYNSAKATHAAEERSREYYANIGIPEMAAHYHAHRLSDVESVGSCRIVSAPSVLERWRQWTGRPVSPFTHVVVRKR